MTNSRQNTLIIGGVLTIGAGALAGIIVTKTLDKETVNVMGNLLNLIVGGLIGFLSRGTGQSPPNQTDPPPEQPS